VLLAFSQAGCETMGVAITPGRAYRSNPIWQSAFAVVVHQLAFP